MAGITKRWSRWLAARNLTRLYADDLSPREAERVNPWSGQDSTYKNEFLSMAKLLADMETLADDPQLAIWRREARRFGKQKRRIKTWLAAVSAIGMVCIGIAGLYNAGVWDSWPDKGSVAKLYLTQIGEQKTITLADGSVITLNTGTKLSVDINDRHRHIVLDRGEAYFDVARDIDRPFTVEVGPRSVSVLGTAFNIRKAPDKFTLAVVEGEVALHQKEENVSDSAPLMTTADGLYQPMSSPPQVRIAAGWVAEFHADDNELSGYKAADMEKLQDWRNGQIHIDGEPLYKVVQELNRYSHKKILIEDASIVNLEMYAVLRFENIGVTLTGMEKMLPIKVVHHFDRIVVVGKDSTDFD